MCIATSTTQWVHATTSIQHLLVGAKDGAYLRLKSEMDVLPALVQLAVQSSKTVTNNCICVASRSADESPGWFTKTSV